MTNETQEAAMNTKTWLVAVLAAVVVMGSAAGGAWALDPDADQMTIRITPNVDYGINLDTATAQFDTGDAAGDLDVSLSLN
ncbi:MAG: hypothetical protein HY554_09845, partial [Elusimicrobia bacterium]|nr:hypothetical protein [Elusimicrobiota bacterium]